MELIPSDILNAYSISANSECTQIGSGLINRTFLVYDRELERKYIVQEINKNVFLYPDVIAENIELLKDYLQSTYPNYLFPAPIANVEGNLMTDWEGTAWRIQPYVENTITLDTLSDPQQAFEAAAQFGRFTKLLKDFPTKKLGYPIKQFHDLDLRIEQYKEALKNGSASRRLAAADAISLANYYLSLSDFFNSYLKRSDFPDRVIHHDTKISNVLLEKETYKGICVIDLDTVMPGKFTSDLGDMMRTYLSAFSENEQDIQKINIRLEYFEALIKGYLSEMKDILTATEKELILFSGKYIIYMQALRFLTDYLNGDIYYKTSYEDQNLQRSRNQFALLKDLYKKEGKLQNIIDKYLK